MQMLIVACEWCNLRLVTFGSAINNVVRGSESTRIQL